MPKLVRTQASHRSPGIHMIEDVPRVGAECKAVALAGALAKGTSRPASPASAATETARRAVSFRSVSTHSPSLRATFIALDFGADADGLAQTQVERELPGAVTKIDRNPRIGGKRIEIEIAKGSGLEVRSCCRIRSERRTVIEDEVTIQVLAQRDVKRRSRIHNHERAHAESRRQRNASAEEAPIAYIIRGPAIIGRNAQQRI